MTSLYAFKVVWLVPRLQWSGSHYSPEKAFVVSCMPCWFWFNECRGVGLTTREAGR